MYYNRTVSIEVQSRRDADKSGSSPYSLLTLPRLMIQRGGASLLFSFTYEMVCVVRGEGSPTFIFFRVGSRQKHIWKVIRRSKGHATSKCTWTGGRPGSADPGGRPAPPGRLSSLSSSRSLICGPMSRSRGAFALVPPFALTCGPSL